MSGAASRNARTRKAHNNKAKDESVYIRGHLWLGTASNSPNWYVYRYDPEKGRNVGRTTGTDDLTLAMIALDEMFLADRGMAPAYCDKCGQKIPDGNIYLLRQAIRDYKIEHASKKVSYQIIRARLAHIERFIEERDTPDLPCSGATNDEFVEEFRAWLLPQPVIWTNANDEVTASHPRTVSSVEESVHQLRAVLNHAVRKERSDAKPVFKAKSRAVVTKPIRARASVDILADMVKWASQPNERREGLLRFLVASICTAARPDSIFDMNIDPEREQWWKHENRFDLNPHGREQTKKFRPVVPILPPLRNLLDTAGEGGWVVHYYGRRVADVRTSWRNMVDDLGLGKGRGYGAYLMRRSMAQLLREGQASPWDVQGLLGHRMVGTTELYTSQSLFPTAMTELESIIADIEAKSGYSLSAFVPNLHLSNEKDPE